MITGCISARRISPSRSSFKHSSLLEDRPRERASNRTVQLAVLYTSPVRMSATCSASLHMKVYAFSSPLLFLKVTRRPGPFLGMYPFSQLGSWIRIPYPPQSHRPWILSFNSTVWICALSIVMAPQSAEYPKANSVAVTRTWYFQTNGMKHCSMNNKKQHCFGEE